MRSWCLPRVDSGCEVDDLLVVEQEWSVLFVLLGVRKEESSTSTVFCCRQVLSVRGDSVLGSDGDHFDLPPFEGVEEHLSVEVHIVGISEFDLHLVNLVIALLIGERVREGKVSHFTGRVGEQMSEGHNELLILVDVVLHLSRDSSPLFVLLIRHHLEDRSESL
jgi:hypothetical protein